MRYSCGDAASAVTIGMLLLAPSSIHVPWPAQYASLRRTCGPFYFFGSGPCRLGQQMSDAERGGPRGVREGPFWMDSPGGVA